MSQTEQELAKIKAFYYGKIAEGLSTADASMLIQIRVGDYWYYIGCGNEPKWDIGFEYRIVPETVVHPGGEYPLIHLTRDLPDEVGTYFWCMDGNAEKTEMVMVLSSHYIRRGHVSFYAIKPSTGYMGDCVDLGGYWSKVDFDIFKVSK